MKFTKSISVQNTLNRHLRERAQRAQCALELCFQQLTSNLPQANVHTMYTTCTFQQLAGQSLTMVAILTCQRSLTGARQVTLRHKAAALLILARVAASAC
jgi:hypothetical protein